MDPIKLPVLRSPLSSGLNGMATAVDLRIVLPKWGDYERLKANDKEALATYVHEWIHYFQFVSTNAGHALIDMHRTHYLSTRRYLHYLALHHAWDFSCPALEWSHQEDSSPDQSVKLMRDLLRVISEILNRSFTYFGDRGYEAKAREIPRITVEGDFKTAHSKVAIGEWEGGVNIVQVLEHAAVTAEAMFSGGFPSNRFFSPAAADYFFGYWYLHQQRVIKLTPVESKKKVKISFCNFDEDPRAVMLHMFLFTQIAMNIPEMCYLETATKEGTDGGVFSELDPNNALPRCELMSRLVGTYFCELLENFCDCAEVVKKEYSKTNSWIQAASAVCEFRKWPRYDTALQVGVSRMEAFIAHFPSEWRNDGGIFDYFHRSSEKCMLGGIRNLLNNDDTNVMPWMTSGEMVFPKILCFTENGERRSIGLTLPGMTTLPTFDDTPKQISSFLFEELRVCEGLLFENPIACYPPLENDELARAFSVWPCDDFKSCRQSWKRGDTDFCTNSGWQYRRNMKEWWQTFLNKNAVENGSND